MDTTISKMIKLIGTALVSASLIHAYNMAALGNWGVVVWTSIWAAVTAAAFTIAWAVITHEVTDLLQGKSRSEVTSRSVISPAIAAPAVIVTVIFVSTGVAASSQGNWEVANWIFVAGSVCCVALTALWGFAEYAFLNQAKTLNK